MQERPTEHGLGVHGVSEGGWERLPAEEGCFPILVGPGTPLLLCKYPPRPPPPQYTPSSVTSGRGCFPGGAVMDTGRSSDHRNADIEIQAEDNM